MEFKRKIIDFFKSRQRTEQELLIRLTNDAFERGMLCGYLKEIPKDYRESLVNEDYTLEEIIIEYRKTLNKIKCKYPDEIDIIFLNTFFDILVHRFRLQANKDNETH